MSNSNITIEALKPLQGLVERIDAVLTRLEEDQHEDLVAAERWGDEGGYCP